MKLQMIKEELKDFLDNSKANIEVIGGSYKIVNWGSIFGYLLKLDKYNFLHESVQNIFNISANFRIDTTEHTTDSSGRNNFIRLYEILKTRCQAVVGFIDTIYDKEDNNNIDNELNFRLYPIEDLKELQNCIKDINFIFTQCPIFDETLEIKFKRVDIGSNMLVVSILTGAVEVLPIMILIAELVSKCYDIRLKAQQLKNNDLSKKLKEIGKDEDKTFIDKYCKIFNEQNNEEKKELYIKVGKEINSKKIKKIEDSESNGEDISRLIKTIETLCDLLNKGLEIYPSIIAKDEIKQCFPKQKSYPQLKKETPLLKEREDKKEENIEMEK